MEKADVDAWLRRYIAAWKSSDRAEVAALFADDIEYSYHPRDDPIRGRQAVVDSWLGEGDHAGASTPDPPGTYDATYRCVAVDGEVAVATGYTTYLVEPGGDVDKVYDNCFVMRFDGSGLCRAFTEWFMERPRERVSGT